MIVIALQFQTIPGNVFFSNIYSKLFTLGMGFVPLRSKRTKEWYARTFSIQYINLFNISKDLKTKEELRLLGENLST